MRCPNCRKEATVEHIQQSEECAQVIASLCARYRVSKRKTVVAGGGRGNKGPVDRSKRDKPPKEK